MLEELIKALYIAKKDLKEYYLKPGTVGWGVMFPFAFTLAFLLKRGGGSLWIAPGLVSLTIFFSSTSMSATSIVFERKTGSFERLLLFPVRYASIALGKALGSFFFSLLTSLSTVLVIYLLIRVPPANLLLFAVCVLAAVFQSSSFGVLLSFGVKDPSQTMTVFNLVRFPMLFLSGVIIPLSSLPVPLQALAYAMPLTYITGSIRYSYLGFNELVFHPLLSLVAVIAQSIIFIALTAWLIKKSIP